MVCPNGGWDRVKSSMSEIKVTLQCCSTDNLVKVDDKRVADGLPNDVRQNIVCKNCKTLVILSFEFVNGTSKISNQEVVR